MDKDKYVNMIETLALSSKEPALCLFPDTKHHVRLLGWPVHFYLYIDNYERPAEAVYEKWTFNPSFASKSSRECWRMFSCWVLDKKDGNKLKIVDFVSDYSIDHFITYRVNFGEDPGGANGPDFSIVVDAKGRATPSHLQPSWRTSPMAPLTPADITTYKQGQMKERLLECRRKHTPDEAALLQKNIAVPKIDTAKLNKVLEELYDLSKNPGANPVAKQNALAQYNQMTGKKRPEFWIS